MKIKYPFSSIPFKTAGNGGWIFVALPKEISQEIRTNFKTDEEGWGRLPVTALIGLTEWKTAIWFDTKQNTYLLPLKAEIRKKENIAIGKQVEAIVFV